MGYVTFPFTEAPVQECFWGQGQKSLQCFGVRRLFEIVLGLVLGLGLVFWFYLHTVVQFPVMIFGYVQPPQAAASPTTQRTGLCLFVFNQFARI